MAQIAPEALELIKEFEGYLKQIGGGYVKPYLCPAHVPTIGYGSTFYENGTQVKLTDPPIDKSRATELLDYELDRVCAPTIAAKVHVPLHPLMRGALMSFAFNVGTGALASSTLLKRVNSQDWEDVPREFKKWTRGGGVVLAGLVRRRNAEAALFMQGVSMLGSNTDISATPPAHPATPAQPASWWSRLTNWLRK